MSGIIYQPLNRERREIRLIILEDENEATKDKGLESIPLRCQLVTTSLKFYNAEFDDDYLEKAKATFIELFSISSLVLSALIGIYRAFMRMQRPSYSALSYVWGDPKHVCDIAINGKMAKITKSLANALRSIRKNTKIRVIWADAICINQQDFDEKSWQVQEMAAIYKRADRVISWLGPATVQVEAAFAAFGDLKLGPVSGISKLADQRRPKINVALVFSDSVLAGLGLRFVPMLCKRIFKKSAAAKKDAILRLLEDEEFWRSIYTIANCSYWSRVWISQELAFARSRVFLCGDTVVEEFDFALQVLKHWHRNAKRNLLFDVPSIVSMTHDLGIRKRKVRLGSKPGRYRQGLLSMVRGDDFPYLLTLLRRLHTLNATDPRDYVYALISMAGDRRELNITADYTKPVATIFTETAAALLQCGHLSILIDAIRDTSQSDLPSWVPDWSHLVATKFKASLFELCKYRIRQQSSTLKRISRSSESVDLDGYIVDEIKVVGDTLWSKISGQTSVHPNVIKSWVESVHATIWDHRRYLKAKNAQKASTKQKITSEMLLTASIGCEATNRDIRSRSSWDPLPVPVGVSIGLIPQRAERPFQKLENILKKSWTKSNPETIEMHFDQWNKMMRDLLASENGAQPFQTLTGYSCLAAHDRCQSGDLVVIIPGVGLPLVVRKIAEGVFGKLKYRLIDQAYVHGIMYGEFFKQKPRPERQTLTLC